MGGLNRPTPFGFHWRSHTIFIVATVSVGLFSDTFLYGVIIPVLPAILEDRIGVDPSDLQAYSSLLLATFALSSALCSPFAGFVADRSSSRKLPFILGLLMLMTGTIVFFAGHSRSILIAARCIQGASSGLIWTTGFALCVDTVGSKRMGKVLSVVLSFVNIGTLCSPPIGGIIYHHLGVKGVAAVSISILVLGISMQLLLIEKKAATCRIHKSTTDVGRSPATPHHESNPTDGEESAHDEESPLLRGGSKLEDYVIAPSQNSILKAAPILYCLRNSSLVVAIVICGVQWALIGSFDATIALEANNLFQFSPLKAGLLFIPVTCGRLVAGPIAGWAVDRYGPKRVALLGFSFLVPILSLFQLVKSEPHQAEVVFYCALLTLCGVGMAIVDTPSFVEACVIAERYEKCNPDLFGEKGAVASLCGITFMAFGIGSTAGPLLAGGLRDSIGYGKMNAVLSGLAGVSAIASFVWLGGPPAIFGNSEKGRFASLKR